VCWSTLCWAWEGFVEEELGRKGYSVKRVQTDVQIGVIGGSGLYEMDGLIDRETIQVDTPFGEPSAPFIIGTLHGKRVAFLARHGHGHRLMPSELNFRANIYGLKTLGIQWILSASAVGSLQERYRPLDIVIPDQFFDRTRGRVSSFFGGGIVAHVGFAHPFCPGLSEVAFDAASRTEVDVHRGGTYLCMEGPQFSTLAESRLYRSWGLDIIGMTNLQEAKLAREAEMCYATLALVTDYDCWHEGHDDVTVEMIIATLTQNAVTAQQVVSNAVSRLPIDRDCECASALGSAIITRPNMIPSSVKRDLAPIIGKYVPAD